MKTKYNFKKYIFSNIYKIYEVDKEIGFIKRNYLSNITVAELNEERFIYKEKGFFNKETEIINSENRIVGKINYKNWRKEAFLNLFGNKIFWQYKNMWNIEWKIINTNGDNIEFSIDGNIKVNEINGNELEILTGLYIHNYYQKAKIVVMIIIFTPIFLNSFS